jgi:cytochrome c oxidase subunit 4
VETNKSADYRRIYIIFFVLAVLTIAEYFVSTQLGSTIFLVLIALAKAALIVQFFMHVYRLWREEAH